MCESVHMVKKEQTTNAKIMTNMHFFMSLFIKISWGCSTTAFLAQHTLEMDNIVSTFFQEINDKF